MKKYIFAFFLPLFFCLSSNATHIVGGEIYYECIGLNGDGTVSFQIFCNLYRDTYSGGANCDPSPNFGLYRQLVDGTWEHVRTINTNLIGDAETIIPDDDPCVIEPVNQVGVEACRYGFPINDLDIISQSYKITYQRCCRNNSISNIQNPGDTGIALEVEITPEAQATCNSSPIFNRFPPIFICQGFSLDVDQGATDADGDSLVYRFCSPLESGGTDGTNGGGNANSCTGVTPLPDNCPPPYDGVVYLTPQYATQFPLAGDPLVNINLNTGIIGGVPQNLGQFTVGVCVEEWRDAQTKIGEVRRDFQFNVLPCEPIVFADVEADLNNNVFDIISCGENTVFIKNLSQQQQFIQLYEWIFEIEGQMDTFTTRDLEITFPDIGEYTGQMIINRGFDCSDTADITVGIYPSIEGEFEFSYDTCVAGPVFYTDLSETGGDQLVSWTWNFGDGTSEVQNPAHTFGTPGNQVTQLIVEDNNTCKDTVTKIIEYFPAPNTIIIEPNAFVGCAPADIIFSNLTMPIDDSYDITWSFGDGNGSKEISPQNVFEDPGTYTIQIDIVSPLGCPASATFENWINVKEGPLADFDFDPKELTSLDKLTNFTDMSVDGIAWQWSFGDQGFSQLQNPTYEFPDTGTYRVQLVTFHETGCTDTLVKFVDIKPLSIFHFPNAFTPNFDGTNETFKGIGIIDGLANFELNIWNRWGELVFNTNDPNEGWDGRKNNNGDLSPGGVYVYTYTFKGARNNQTQGKGKVTLIR